VSLVVVCKRAISTFIVLLSPGNTLSPKITIGALLNFAINYLKHKSSNIIDLEIINQKKFNHQISVDIICNSRFLSLTLVYGFKHSCSTNTNFAG
jgi:hypothetical protein